MLQPLLAQDDVLVSTIDSVSTAADTSQLHTVRRATLLSTAFPGAGQFYNGAYWKMPLVYGGIGACIYFAVDNHQRYRRYLDAFFIRIDSNSTQSDQYVGIYSERELIELQNIFRDWRDLSIIFGALVWALNIIDAHVDAHLYYYNVSDDISYKIEPNLFYVNNFPAIGLRLKLTLP